MIDRISTAASCVIAKAILESKPLLTQGEAKILGEANNYWDRFVSQEKAEWKKYLNFIIVKKKLLRISENLLVTQGLNWWKS